MRFAAEENAISPDLSAVEKTGEYKPVSLHVLTPCASAVDVAPLEDDATADSVPQASFVETLLLRLLDDLNSGRLCNDDIMKLASYSMDIIASSEQQASGADADLHLTSSSSSMVATKMVDFTLSKILDGIQSGDVHHEELASLTVTFINNLSGTSSGTRVTSDTELDEYIDGAIREALSTAMDSRAGTPAYDAMLEFMLTSLENIIYDLEHGRFTQEELQLLANAVHSESASVFLASDAKHPLGTKGIKEVLKSILSHLQDESIDFQTIYRVVFSLVYVYKQIQGPSSSSYENRITSLLKDILTTVEEKATAGDVGDVNMNIVREASSRLSRAVLDADQIQQITPSLAKVHKGPQQGDSRDAVISALCIAKEKVSTDLTDQQLQQDLQNVAEAVITAVPDRQTASLVHIFFRFMSSLKFVVSNCKDEVLESDIDSLIELLSQQRPSDNVIVDLATAVVHSVHSPETLVSPIPSNVVKDMLENVIAELKDETFPLDTVSRIVKSLHSTCKEISERSLKTPPFVNSMADLLRTVLDHLTQRLDGGACAGDRGQLAPGPTRSDTSHILEHIQHLVQSFEAGKISDEKARILGEKIIDIGRGLLTGPAAEHDSATDAVVQEVIQKLNTEIQNGHLTDKSLKEVAEAIVTSSAEDQTTLPLPANSASASTIASHVVAQTINVINRRLAESGMPTDMLDSLASSVITMLSGQPVMHLSAEFEQHRQVIQDIVACLQSNRLKEPCTREIFSLILQNYKSYYSENEHCHAHDDMLLPEDKTLVNNLVTETLRNIERSVEAGRIHHKTFSIPSMVHSDATSVVADRLIDTCIETINEELTAEERRACQPGEDIVTFILEIVTLLQEELAAGRISGLSMAHFFHAIDHSTQDMKTLENGAQTNLRKVVEDIQEKGGHSIYVHRILETYLLPGAHGVFEDPLKAIESILVNVSSEILTKFVKATLQTILMDIRSDDSRNLKERAPSGFVLRSASSIVAENVIKEVVSRIKEDISQSVHKIHGAVSKRDVERAASRLLSASPRAPSRKEQPSDTNSESSFISVNSKELEDIVLEAMHNIVSNLRLDASMSQQSGGKGRSESDISREVDDFVLQTLQDIVADQQDRRSQVDLGVSRTEGRPAGSSVELTTGESRDAMTYVNEVLHAVLGEMQHEMTQLHSDVCNTGKSAPELASSNIQMTIIESIQHALSDSSNNNLHQMPLQTYQREDVRTILVSCIQGTIKNIKMEKFCERDLDAMYQSCCSALEIHPSKCPVVHTDVAEIMQQVLAKIESLELSDVTLADLTSQLATLGMDGDAGSSNGSSVGSSRVSGLVKDVLARLVEQLTEPSHVEGCQPVQEQHPPLGPPDGGSKTDRNFNRRKSSTTTVNSKSLTSNSTASTVIAKQGDQGHAQIGKHASVDKSKLKRQTKTPTKKDFVKPHVSSAAANKKANDVSKDRGERVTNKQKPVGSGAPSRVTTTKNLVTAYVRSLNPTAKITESKNKQTKRNTNVKRSSKDSGVKKNGNAPTTKNTVLSNGTVSEKASCPLQLRSLCGSHKAAVRYLPDQMTHDASAQN